MQERFHLAGFDIEAFPVFHDAPETIGFQICAGGKKITIATDLGHICQTAAPYIQAANLLVIESNYDEQMLVNGRYPHYLKARIQSDHGHLGNHQTSVFLADIFSESSIHICLAHLSKNNNTPEMHDHGIQVNGSFVLGFDHDGREVFDTTMEWVEDNRLECATFHIMTPYPGTPLFRRREAEARLLHRNWSLSAGV